MSKVRILSIDGGGIRGIIPGQILVVLENKIQKMTGQSDARLSDYFDMIAGTSTGGILSCLYLCPDPDDPCRAKYSAEDAVNLYLQRGGQIFDISTWQKIRSAKGLRDEKFSANELESAFVDYFGDLKLSELLKPCLLTSYDVKRRRSKFFTQHDADQNSHDYYVRDVARATSAAPTYFELAHIKSMSDVPYPLVDGGIFANNPTLCAYSEARKHLPGKPTAKDMVILSLGTGKIEKEYDYDAAKNWGLIEWVAPLIDMMMSGVSETVDYQLQQIFDAIECPDQYVRINSSLLFANTDMDDASEENLLHLQQDGTRIAEEHDEQLNTFLNYLLETESV